MRVIPSLPKGRPRAIFGRLNDKIPRGRWQLELCKKGNLVDRLLSTLSSAR